MENYFIWKFISYGDLILFRMENDAAIYPLHFENPKFCKTNPLFSILYIALLGTLIYKPPVYN